MNCLHILIIILNKNVIGRYVKNKVYCVIKNLNRKEFNNYEKFYLDIQEK